MVIKIRLKKIAAIVLCFTYYSCFANQGENDHSDFIGDRNGVHDTLGLRKETIRGNQKGIILDKVSSRSKGYQIQFTLGILAGKTKLGSEYNKSFNISNGYQFQNGLSLGVGCGAEQLAVPVIPFYGEIIYHFIDNRLSPYLYLKSGYGFAFVEKDDRQYYYEDYINDNPKDSKGGFLFNAGVGLANFTWDKAAVVLGIGYRYQRVTESLRMWNGMYRELETNFNTIEVKFGFIFR